MKSLFSHTMARYVFAVALLFSVPTGYAQDEEGDDSVQDVPGLPRVLIIGDSIGQNYTPYVRELLKGKANVHIQSVAASRGGGRIANRALERGPWDLIHFNVGLWDMAYRGGQLTATPEVYERNLRGMTQKLKESGAKLIFATITPVPDGTDIRKVGDELNYNAVAVRAMKDLGVEVFDLHAVAEQKANLQMAANVHYTAEGYKYLADAVARTIMTGLGGGVAAGLSAETVRTWTDAKGSTLAARMMTADGNSVTLEREGGASMTLPLSALSAADQAYVRQWLLAKSGRR